MSEKFEYQYTAPTPEEKKEINSIRNQYLPKDQTISKLEQLKKLDKKVKTLPEALAISCGTISLLLFGLGLTCFLEWDLWYLGIPCAMIGTILMIICYPIYIKILNHNKEKYREQIIKLSDELLNEENK